MTTEIETANGGSTLTGDPHAPVCADCGRGSVEGVRLLSCVDYTGGTRVSRFLCTDHRPIPDTVYADGGVCGKNGGPDPATAGTWAYCWVKDGRRVYEASGIVTVDDFPGLTRTTNNVTELVAVIKALKSLPRGWTGKLCTDSDCTIKRLSGTGIINNCPPTLEAEAYRIRAKLPQVMTVTFVLLDGHPTPEELSANRGSRGHPVSMHNVWCDDACNAARRWYEQQEKQTQ